MNTLSLPIEYLHECFSADFETGALTWRTRPLEHFKTKRAYSTWNSRFAGREALANYHSEGYKQGRINGRKYKAHRVIFALYHGEWPADQIDHINGRPDDNRIINLRAVSCGENLRNKRKQRNNTSGVVGVSWHKRDKKWVVRIQAHGREKHLGYFESLPEAAAERKHAERIHGFHPNHGRD